MRRRRLLGRSCVVALCAIAMSAGACATATGEVSGGELRKDFDPNAPPEVFTPPGPGEDSFADAGDPRKDFAFQPAQIERMQAWIRAGARND